MRPRLRALSMPPVRLAVVVPGLVVVAAAVAGLMTSGASDAASGQGSSTGPYSAPAPTTSSTSTSSSAPSSSTATSVSPWITSSNATEQLFQAPGSPITYSVPTDPADIAAGDALFQANCASCHGSNGAGGTGPSLLGVGAATVDFWVSTGRMPLRVASAQAVRKPSAFTAAQTRQIVAFVNSLDPQLPGSPASPGIPTVDTANANLEQGNEQFVLNCAACHTITGAGDALADGAVAPSLHQATATQIAEAIRTGPGNMPQFGPDNLTDQQVADIVAYVRGPIQHPDNAGGLALGGVGPVAEGFVALLIGVGALMLACFWIGERARD